MRTLIIDIETSPLVVHSWGLFKQTIGINQIMEATRVIAVAAKWHGEKKVMFFSEFHDGREAMIEKTYALLDEADVAVHFNGKTFDIPHLNREFVLAGLNPPSPYKQVDLLETVKRQFRFPSNKLAYVTEKLGLSGKMVNSGHSLWVRCMEGDAKAWAEMKRYAVQDVRVEEELYDRLLPWIPSHPHRGLYDSRPECCPRCGGTTLHSRGKAYTPLGVFNQYQCQDCGGWSRGGKRLETVEVRAV